MQADQTVSSLRPGGGNRGRSVGPGFDSSAFGSSDLPILRPHGGAGAPSVAAFKIGDSRFELRERVRYTRDQPLQTRKLPSQNQARYSEPDNRDWRGRFAPGPVEERSRDAARDNRDFGRFDNKQQETHQYNWQDQLNLQFGKAQISSNQGSAPTPALIKAKVPWSARKGALSKKDRVLKTVEG